MQSFNERRFVVIGSRHVYQAVCNSCCGQNDANQLFRFLTIVVLAALFMMTVAYMTWTSGKLVSLTVVQWNVT